MILGLKTAIRPIQLSYSGVQRAVLLESPTDKLSTVLNLQAQALVIVAHRVRLKMGQN